MPILPPDVVPIQTVVEGDVDLIVVERLVGLVGGTPGATYGRRGKEWIRQRMTGFRNAANFSPWAVLVDLDPEAECAPLVLTSWVPPPRPRFLCFRVAIRQVEAWLLADPAALSNYLAVTPGRLPADPDSLDHAKLEMVNLARHSTKRAIREDMCPRPGSGRATGPAYSSRLIEYASVHWRPDVAEAHSESLSRTIRCLRDLISDYAVQLTGAGAK